MFFKDMLGRELAIAVGEEPAAGDVLLVFDESLLPELGDEGYYLDIGDAITITAPTKIGLQYGGTTITQILYQDDAMRNVPKGKVRDYPAYEVRSQQLEVGRRYMDLGYVEEMAKYMAWFKMSELHMHINENGGEYSASFIVESKLYPEINRNNKDYMWTQDEYRQFQKNVKEFGIDVVTEIDTRDTRRCLAMCAPT
ncbi:MAG: glycoside hydrolase family 20 zincin-like fold domain-containing protein [Oscillospiraceae bacterium]